jgi:hypothetical protein
MLLRGAAFSSGTASRIQAKMILSDVRVFGAIDRESSNKMMGTCVWIKSGLSKCDYRKEQAEACAKTKAGLPGEELLDLTTTFRVKR